MGSPRIVRVGTHELTSGSATTLWNRLSQHKGSTAGRRAGGGNHRGSILRLHRPWSRPPVEMADPKTWHGTWGKATPARMTFSKRNISTKCVVSAVTVLWLDVPDEPGPLSARGVVGAGSIGLSSRRSNELADPARSSWLGHHVERETIRTSALWNIRHVDDPPTKTLSLTSSGNQFRRA